MTVEVVVLVQTDHWPFSPRITWFVGLFLLLLVVAGLHYRALTVLTEASSITLTCTHFLFTCACAPHLHGRHTTPQAPFSNQRRGSRLQATSHLHTRGLTHIHTYTHAHEVWSERDAAHVPSFSAERWPLTEPLSLLTARCSLSLGLVSASR